MATLIPTNLTPPSSGNAGSCLPQFRKPPRRPSNTLKAPSQRSLDTSGHSEGSASVTSFLKTAMIQSRKKALTFADSLGMSYSSMDDYDDCFSDDEITKSTDHDESFALSDDAAVPLPVPVSPPSNHETTEDEEEPSVSTSVVSSFHPQRTARIEGTVWVVQPAAAGAATSKGGGARRHLELNISHHHSTDDDEKPSSAPRRSSGRPRQRKSIAGGATTAVAMRPPPRRRRRSAAASARQ